MRSCNDPDGLWTAAMVFAVISLIGQGIACGITLYRADTGHERGRCYGNKTCNTGLSCLSEVCVKEAPTP